MNCPPQLKPTNTAPNASIEKEKRRLRLEKLRLERELEGAQAKYEAATNGSALAQHFLGEPITDKGEELMLRLLERKASKALKKYSLEEQEYLQWRIRGLEKMLEE